MSKRPRELPEWSVVVPTDARHGNIVYDSDYPPPDAAAAAIGGPMRLQFDGSSPGVCVIEYSEKHPPFCLKPGMASDFVLFSPAQAMDSEESPDQQQQQMQGQPFLGDCVEPQLAMINPLFKVPLFSAASILQNGLPKGAAPCGRPCHLLQNGLIAGSCRSPSNLVQNGHPNCSECGMDDGDCWCESCENAFCNDCWRKHSCAQQTTDFLISHGRTLIPIRQVFVAGQQEPQSHTASGKEQVVPHVKMTHDAKHYPHGNLTCYSEQEMMLAIGIAKFGTANRGREITFEELARAVLSRFSRTDPSRKNLRKMFKQLVCGTPSRRAMMTAADNGNKMIWTDDVPEYSVENLTRLVSPENVCLIESTLRAEYRLRQLGIFRALRIKDINRYLDRLHKLRDFKVKRASYLENCPKLLDYLVDDIVSVDRRIDIVNFILRQVINAPWNTTEAFVRARVDGIPLDIQSPLSPNFFAFLAAANDGGNESKNKKKRLDAGGRPCDFRKKCNDAWQRQQRLVLSKNVAPEEEEETQGDRRSAVVRDIRNEFGKPGRDEERQQNQLVALRVLLRRNLDEKPAAPVAAPAAPKKVVRRVTRTVYEDGTEVVRFEFLTTLREVNAATERIRKRI
jgi:hypothetical protein